MEARKAPSDTGVVGWKSGLGGVLLLLWVAQAYRQPLGIVGAFDALAFADQRLEGVEWWGWPLFDGAFGVVISAGAVAAGIASLRHRPEAHVRWREVGYRLSWLGVLVTVLSVGARMSIITALDVRRASWLVAGAAAVGSAAMERRFLSRWPDIRAAVHPLAGLTTGLSILAVGALGVGFLRAAACRLVVAVVESLAARR